MFDTKSAKFTCTLSINLYSVFCTCCIWCRLFGRIICRPSDSRTWETLLSLTSSLPFSCATSLWFACLLSYVCVLRSTITNEILTSLQLQLSALFRCERDLCHTCVHKLSISSICSFSIIYFYFLFSSNFVHSKIMNLRRFIDMGTSLASHCCSQYQTAIK